MEIQLPEALQILRSGDVAAVPTETVYGLAGLISSEAALRKIFETKQRPFFDPLIVHVENISQARSLVSEWSPQAQALAEAFWPGPLTIVIKKNSRVSDLITSGLERVGLRCPRHPVALDLLKKLGEAFAAPSANLFGRTSPTTAEHVEKEFNGKVPVLNGGPCEIGIESTVLLVDNDKLSILRSGHIQKSDIEKTLQNRSLTFQWLSHISKSESPGHMKHHYMPAKPLFWVQGGRKTELLQILNQKLSELPSEVEGVKLIKPLQIRTTAEMELSSDSVQAARELYSELRRLAESPVDALIFYFEPVHSNPEWEAVMERLRKASSLVIS